MVLLGYPGSVSSFWQRAGRAGRGRQRSLVLWIPREDPMDAYFEQHPELLLQSAPESAVADPDNPTLFPLHAHCAARELPIALPPEQDAFYKPWHNIQPPHRKAPPAFLHRAQPPPGPDPARLWQNL